MHTPALSTSPTLLTQPVTPQVQTPTGAEPTGFRSALDGLSTGVVGRVDEIGRPDLTRAREASAPGVVERLDEIEKRYPGVAELGSRGTALLELAREMARGGVQPTPGELFLLQSELSQVQFGLEMTTKVVEHATSGAKTALQTQM